MLSALAAPLHAQGGRGQTRPAPATVDTARSVPLDRIVAVVGKKGITMSELYEQMNDEDARRQGQGLPPLNPADSLKRMRRIVEGMIDAQLLLQKAEEFKFPIKEEELQQQADAQIKDIRDKRFKSDREFLDALKSEGLNSVEELRHSFIEQERQRRLQRMTVDTLTKLGQMPQISVSERDIEQAFDTLKAQLGPRGPVVTFRQIVIKPTWTDSSDARAKHLADSLLTLLKGGASFDSLAKKFSDDTSSAVQGGDLGWLRRGVTVKEFDEMMFRLPIGQLSPVVKTEFGYHIIRVDRLRPGEVRARHILIMPRKDAHDLARALTTLERLVDTMKAGASFDSIADKYHDGQVHRRKVESKQIDSLPPEYIRALTDLKPGQFSKVFEVSMLDGSLNKAGVLQLLNRNDSGEWTLAEARERIRSDLRQAGSWRRLLDNLRKQTYVAIHLDAPPTGRASQ
ncbi:MAG TPA: peptidylprolyl isomerase [Gemmatimonadaceae bacterium]|nr:peptidylprolyl isomerase [Gemmatimonadaceae bacterium]